MTTPPPQHDDLGGRSQLWPKAGIDLPRYLAWLTKPVMPLVERFGMRVPRRGRRGFSPDDMLLPAGYRAELVASGAPEIVRRASVAGEQPFVRAIRVFARLLADPATANAEMPRTFE